MKTIGIIMADLDRSPLGTRSRLADEIAGVPVLRRTVERMLRCRSLKSVHVITRPEQTPRVNRILDGLSATVERVAEPPPAYAALVRAGRIWGLDGWRGGVGSLCVFDEDVHIPIAHALAEREKADAVVPMAAAAALLDPALIDAMVAQHGEYALDNRLTIVQAPPGIATIVLGRPLLGELAPTGAAPGTLLAYRPGQPIADLTGKEMCYRPAAEVIEARGRLLCDTRRAFERVLAAVAAGADQWDAAAIGRWLARRSTTHVDAIPEEIEVELTTDDLPEAPSLVRPRGAEVEGRGPIDLAAIDRICEAIEGWDDVRIVLGGFGEPCFHPQFAEICSRFRKAGVAAIAVRTAALWEDARTDTALFETSVDVIEVTLDATTPETYHRVHGRDGFDRARAAVERWTARRVERRSVLPLVVPSFVKCNENLHEMEAFFDEWMGREGVALISGYSHCAGQRPRRAVTVTAPPARSPCRRTFTRTLILADGRMTTCDQDFAGRQALGSILESPLADLWASTRLSAIRSNQSGGLPLCPTCEEWHRP